MAIIAIVSILAETSLVKFALWHRLWHILLRDIMLVDAAIAKGTLTVSEVLALTVLLLEFCPATVQTMEEAWLAHLLQELRPLI